MPYLSIAERERMRWVSLPEAVAHVCAVDQCSAQDAQVQIRKALADGELIARWEDSGTLKVLDDGSLKYEGLFPPRAEKIWLEIYLDWDSGEMVNHLMLIIDWLKNQSNNGSKPFSKADLEEISRTAPISENPRSFPEKYGFTTDTHRFDLTDFLYQS